LIALGKMTICPNKECGEEVPDYQRNCVVCGTDAGYPNVRKAERSEELEAVEKRFQKVLEDCKTRDCYDVMEQFRMALTNSEAVLCRPLAKLLALVESDNELYATYYQLVNAENRLPEKNVHDTGRSAVDSTLFPNYHQYIRFAALTLSGKGPTYYGECSVLLKEIAIRDRASVFEENSYDFFQKSKITIGTQLSAGYRSTWASRDRLAIAKLGSRVDKNTVSADFPNILIKDTKETPDFIEVHIYGPIHRRAIKAVVMKEPKRKADRILLASLGKKLTEIKADLTVQS
jgi:hypothetical protein